MKKINKQDTDSSGSTQGWVGEASTGEEFMGLDLVPVGIIVFGAETKQKTWICMDRAKCAKAGANGQK